MFKRSFPRTLNERVSTTSSNAASTKSAPHHVKYRKVSLAHVVCK